jgi:hypothetical protein
MKDFEFNEKKSARKESIKYKNKFKKDFSNEDERLSKKNIKNFKQKIQQIEQEELWEDWQDEIY